MKLVCPNCHAVHEVADDAVLPTWVELTHPKAIVVIAKKSKVKPLAELFTKSKIFKRTKKQKKRTKADKAAYAREYYNSHKKGTPEEKEKRRLRALKYYRENKEKINARRIITRKKQKQYEYNKKYYAKKKKTIVTKWPTAKSGRPVQKLPAPSTATVIKHWQKFSETMAEKDVVMHPSLNTPVFPGTSIEEF